MINLKFFFQISLEINFILLLNCVLVFFYLLIKEKEIVVSLNFKKLLLTLYNLEGLTSSCSFYGSSRIAFISHHPF